MELVDSFFLYQHLKYIIPLCLDSVILAEKSALQPVAPPYMMSTFSLAAFKILSAFDFQQFDYNLSRCGSLWVILLAVHWVLRFVEHVFIHL